MYLMPLPKKLIKSRKSGEISVYLCLVFTLMVSLIISAVSAARRAAVQTLFECSTESMLCSVFGEYNRELAERYGVFFIDLSYLSNSPDPMNLESRMNSYFRDNLHPEEGTSFLFCSDIADISAENVSLTGYELATDNMGRPFMNAAIDYMKNKIGINDVESIANLIAVTDTYDLSEDRYNEIKEETISGINSIEEDSWEKTEIKESLLKLVIPDIEFTAMLGKNMYTVSTEQINYFDTLSMRKKEKGKGFDSDVDFDLLNGIYFNEYILSKFGTYTTPKENTKLRYEAEYVISGFGNDYYNLRQAVKDIFIFRVIEDIIALNMAEDKMNEIRAITEPIATALEIPEIILTEAVVFIWSYVEGMSDIWLLLDGHKVPLIKRSDQFNISRDGILPFGIEIIEGGLEVGDELPKESSEAENAEENPDSQIEIGYDDYIRIFLNLTPPVTKAYHVMDLIEVNLRNCGSGENAYFRFDCCVDKIRVHVSCESGYGLYFDTYKEYSFL